MGLFGLFKNLTLALEVKHAQVTGKPIPSQNSTANAAPASVAAGKPGGAKPSGGVPPGRDSQKK